MHIPGAEKESILPLCVPGNIGNCFAGIGFAGGVRQRQALTLRYFQCFIIPLRMAGWQISDRLALYFGEKG